VKDVANFVATKTRLYSVSGNLKHSCLHCTDY
jgi:hypothetical protein